MFFCPSLDFFFVILPFFTTWANMANGRYLNSPDQWELPAPTCSSRHVNTDSCVPYTNKRMYIATGPVQTAAASQFRRLPHCALGGSKLPELAVL